MTLKNYFFLPDDMNNWLLTSLNQIETMFSRYILKIVKMWGQYCKNKASPTAGNFTIFFIGILQTAFIFQNVQQ